MHQLITCQVLQVLLDNNLLLKPEKCMFEVTEVEYLGVIISHGTMHMDLKKIEVVASWPTPHNKKDIQQFLGFVNFHCQFIHNFHNSRPPLTGYVALSLGPGLWLRIMLFLLCIRLPPKALFSASQLMMPPFKWKLTVPGMPLALSLVNSRMISGALLHTTQRA